MRKTFLVLLTTFTLVLGFATLADAAAKKSFKVSIKSSVGTSQAGLFITISGKVTGPNAGGKKVTVQRQYAGGAWTTVATVITKPSGKYKARVETPQGGTTSFRAIKAKSSARKAGVSATKALPVYQWLYLSHQNGLSGPDVTPGVTETIAGKTYPQSISIADNTSSSYKLGKLCSKIALVADYQNSNSNPPAAAIDLKIERYEGPTTHGLIKTVNFGSAPTVITLPGANIDYLRFSTNGWDNPYSLVLGDPKVYCNAPRLPSWQNSDF